MTNSPLVQYWLLRAMNTGSRPGIRLDGKLEQDIDKNETNAGGKPLNKGETNK